MPFPGDRTAPVIAGVSLGLDPGRGQHDYGGNTVVFLDQFSADTLWVGRPQSLPAARQAAILWTRPLHTGSFAGTPGTLVWGWLAIAVVALAASGFATRRVRTVAARLEELRWQRQHRRRMVLARQERARAGQAAHHRRRRGRRLRRRRKIQARTRVGVRAPVAPVAPAAPAAPAAAAAPAAPVVYESEITLESGETLESGIVAGLPRR
jgi:hypothetical protein